MSTAAPILLLTTSTPDHVFDDVLHEALLVEGYHLHDWQAQDCGRVDLSPYALVLIGAGAAERMDREQVAAYLAAGGRVIACQPPPDWASLFGLKPLEGNYRVARDAFLRVDEQHPWTSGFPWRDLQVPGENPVYLAETASALAWTAGQLGQRSAYPTVAVGPGGRAVMFTYDLAEVLVRLQQGWPERASTGPDPDANRDGKFTAEEAFEGQRRFELRHVPQADLHRDLLVLVLRQLTDDLPLPRLWHFPHAAPGLLFLDGDGDSMVWEDLELVVWTVEEFGAKFTFYLMEQQIEAFDPAAVRAVAARGHDFGPHAWTGHQPTPEAWAEAIAALTGRLRDKFGLEPVSQRNHCIIFAGWDEAPQALSQIGLPLDTNFCNGFRYQSGYLNGSALLTRFVDHQGRLLDCWEQSTVTMEDGAGSPKILLPSLSQEQALELSRELMHDLAHKYHGVHHPYFHPVSLAGRGSVACYQWFRGVLECARELGLTSVSAREWLAFHQARHGVHVTAWSWDGDHLRFTLTAPAAILGLTVLVPGAAVDAQVDGEPREVTGSRLEHGGWRALTLDLHAGEARVVVIRC